MLVWSIQTFAQTGPIAKEIIFPLCCYSYFQLYTISTDLTNQTKYIPSKRNQSAEKYRSCTLQLEYDT